MEAGTPQPPPSASPRYEHVRWFHQFLRAGDAASLSTAVRALEALVCVQQAEAPLRQLLHEQGLLRPWAPLTTALLQQFFLRKYQVRVRLCVIDVLSCLTQGSRCVSIHLGKTAVVATPTRSLSVHL